MKKATLSLVFLAMLALVDNVYAQEYKHQLANSPENTIEFTVANSDVVIEGHDSNEVVIRNLNYEAPPERAQGLRALYNSAEDNTGIGLSVVEENGTLRIISASNEGGDFRLLVPNRVRVMIEEVNWGGGEFELHNLQGEIEIKSKTADMKLVNVTGPIIAASTSGDMEVTLSSLSQAGPTSISLISGFIDITMPADSKADLYLGSISGEIYTDLNIALRGEKANDMRRLGGSRQVEGALNGGGVEMRLKSISGDIYLRKK